MMGGRIRVESEEGRGSTFHFTARFGRSAGEVRRRELLGADRLKGVAVLAVDDNPTNRRVIGGLLTHWGMRPTVVADGPEALRALREARRDGRPFPVVLTDNMMPGMDGFTLAEQIRANPDLAGATLMMISSAGRREDARRCRELGVAAYLTKPIRRAELMQVLLRALSGVPESAGSTPRRGPHPPPAANAASSCCWRRTTS